MKVMSRLLLTSVIIMMPAAFGWAQESNPGNSGGGHDPIGIPTYPSDQTANPALTTGSRFSVTPSTPTVENPTVAGATGRTIVRGDRSTISNDRRATIQQKTGGVASDAPG